MPIDRRRRPTKEQVRDYLRARVLDPAPPPSPAAIRRRLGWSRAPRARRRDDDESR